MKIGILHCLKAEKVCTGAGCLKVFNNRKAFFEKYKDKDVELAAFFACNGCRSITEEEPSEDKGIIEKVTRLYDEGITIVHIGVCSKLKDGSECRRITEIAHMLEKKGIKVIRGTHN